LRGTGKILRNAIYNLLTGAITYDSTTVKVYDEKKKVGDSDQVFILLSTQQETPTEDNDSAFITRSSIDIEVIAKTEFEVSKDVIDDIGDDIIDLIKPTVITDGYTVPSGYQFQNGKIESSITMTLQITETQSILRKIIKFVVNIVEQT
jgi:hypothetical protein